MRRVLLASCVMLVAGVPAAAQERTLAMGRTVSGLIRDGDPVGRSRRAPYHSWTFEGRRGQRVVFDMRSPEFDTHLTVRDAEGYLIGSDDDSGEGTDSRVRAILPRDGSYRLIATAFSETGRGSYTLSATGWEAPDVAAAGRTALIRAGETRDGILEPGDEMAGDGPFQDRWQFDARQGQRLLLELRSEDFDAYLIVLDPSGAEIGSDDDALGGRDAQLAIRAAQTGLFTIIATSYGETQRTGVYRLTVTEETGEFSEPGEAARIAAGETRPGRLESGDRRGTRGLEDDWVFTGRAGQIARIDVSSGAFDTWISLRRNGEEIENNDDGGEGNNSRLATVLPADGEYTLVVTSFSESRSGGSYRVALNFSEPAPGAGRTERIVSGRRVSGRLEAGDRRREGGAYEDYWEFQGRRDQDITIEMSSDEFDTYLELRGEDGQLIGEDDDGGDGTGSLLVARLPRNGRYRVVARSFGESPRTGVYDLELHVGSGSSAPPGRPGELRLDQMVFGRLEQGDSVMGDDSWADIWVFRAPRDGNLVVEMRSSDFDTYLIMKDSEGETLGTDDDGGGGTNSSLTVPVRSGRTYRIYANSYGADARPGAYRLSARYER